MTTTDTRTTNQKEPAMTTTATIANPHRLATTITGWAVIAVLLGAMYGASHDPANAAWSALALTAMVGIYLRNKVRKAAFDRRTRKQASL